MYLQNVSSDHSGSGSSTQQATSGIASSSSHHLLSSYRGASGLTSPSPGRFPVSPATSVASGAMNGGHSPSIGTHPPSVSPNPHGAAILGCQSGLARTTCPPSVSQATFSNNGRDEYNRKPGNRMFEIVELPEENDVIGLSLL